MSPWLRAVYSSQEDVSEYGFGVSRVSVRQAALRFDRGALRVRRSAALRSCRLSTGMPGRCPFPRLPNLQRARGRPAVLSAVACLSSRLDGKPSSGVAVCCFGSPLELPRCADRAHDHNAGCFEPVGVFARERGPATSVLIARAAALPADQQHVPRHLGADLRGFADSAQGAEEGHFRVSRPSTPFRAAGATRTHPSCRSTSVSRNASTSASRSPLSAANVMR